MADIVPRCEPTLVFQELPYHWVQWRTPFRADDPQPWAWTPSERLWRASGGTLYTPERAAELQWYYLEPALPPLPRARVKPVMAEALAVQYGPYLVIEEPAWLAHADAVIWHLARQGVRVG